MNRYASLFLLIIAVSGVIAFVAWKDFDTSSSSNSALSARRSSTTVERTEAKSKVSMSVTSSVSQSLAPTLNQRFREAKDYAHFVAEIRPMATAGNTEAQYLTAKALKWCAQTMHLYFIRPNGEVHTLEEVQARFAARPVGISQQDLAMIYSRCQGFLESPELRKSTESWNEWLDKSADGAYPAAIAQRAANLELQLILESGSSLPHEDRGVGAEAQAKELALSAAESGDPDAIFLMSDWVRTGNRTDDETATLINAWRILACQKGYDCGPHSDWMISVCSWDPQCADGGTYVNYFQRQLGNQYYDALRLAKSIDEAITANDVQTLRSYL
ncbi:MAG TPA: hypothetical protein VNY80_02350 [Steroidobacteraceae bacterium]|nr:hypothetical protein [Steroidobacteraceae bacterium]